MVDIQFSKTPEDDIGWLFVDLTCTNVQSRESTCHQEVFRSMLLNQTSTTLFSRKEVNQPVFHLLKMPQTKYKRVVFKKNHWIPP